MAASEGDETLVGIHNALADVESFKKRLMEGVARRDNITNQDKQKAIKNLCGDSTHVHLQHTLL